jgi:dTDP-4-amino-4,6-dideoxygalactose transaminase
MVRHSMQKANFALFGGDPEFDTLLPFGQFYFPSWDRYETAFRDIFERQYYTNQGPLVEELEDKLRRFLGVRHAICIANATIGLMMAAEAMSLTGKVILPGLSFIATAQSLTWTGLQPVFCDVDVATHQIAFPQIEALIDEDVSAIVGVNLWGGSCNPRTLSDLASTRGIQLYFNSFCSFGCKVDDARIGNFGQMEIFSFHASQILSAAEGGCICTNDDYLAARLRNIRSGYGIGQPVEVIRTSNGRMSEAQAAIALMSLEDFPANRKNNEKLYREYKRNIELIPGLHLVSPSGVSESNYQDLVCLVDQQQFGLSRDQLLSLLRAENIDVRRDFFPGVHRTLPYAKQHPQYADKLPNTDQISRSCIQFPIGARVSAQIVTRICDLLVRIQCAATGILAKLENELIN